MSTHDYITLFSHGLQNLSIAIPSSLPWVLHGLIQKKRRFSMNASSRQRSRLSADPVGQW